MTSPFRQIPSVDRLLNEPTVAPHVRAVGHETAVRLARNLLEEVRAAIRRGEPVPPLATLARLLADRLRAAARPSLRPVINATGVIVHTNLGRAPLSEAARRAVDTVSRGYSNLEYDLEAGRRGSRYVHAIRLLRDLTGAEDALVVNNNAGAVFLALRALAAGREVLISRGQLIEIGGGFRIPDILAESGAILREVGTTNRTHLEDYARHVSDQTVMVLRVHPSNFRIIGFTTQPSLADLVTFAHAHGLWLMDDLGSGTFLDTRPYGLAYEPRVQDSVAAGADLVTFSGDKLLGGPQAGILVGKADLIDRIRRHPLTRALRVDKMTLAALEATLAAYRRGTAPLEIPVWRMIAAPPEGIRERAERWRQALQAHHIPADVVESAAAVGGGSLPGETLPTWVLAVRPAHADRFAALLRKGEPPVVPRIEEDRVLLDPRTVLPEEDDLVMRRLLDAWQRLSE